MAQEFWRGVRARRAMSDDSVPRALVSLVRRNRRRYGGYIVHAGIAVLFVGIAASTAFKDVRDVQPRPGRERDASATTRSPTRSPPASSSIADSGSLEKIDLGAEMAVQPRRTASR